MRPHRVAAGAVAVGAGGLLLVVLLVAEEPSGSLEASPSTAWHPRDSCAASPGAVTDDPPLTPFQRRLVAGDLLRGLATALAVLLDPSDSDVVPAALVDTRRAAAPLVAAAEALVPDLLPTEGFARHCIEASAAGVNSADAPWRERMVALTYLDIAIQRLAKHPAIDRHTLELCSSTPSVHRLGVDRLLRVWVRRDVSEYGAPTRDDVESAEALLRRLASVAEPPLDRGFDVVATPRLGYELFREEPPAEAAGVYCEASRLCHVGMIRRSTFRGEVLRHELVHAFLHALSEEFTDRRFVGEGLASYFEVAAHPTDGLEVPLAAFRDRFVLLLKLLRQRSAGGVAPESTLVWLLEASPSEFYGTEDLGYLVAVSAIAFVGPEPLEQSLRVRSDAPLVEALRRVGWRELLDFVTEHAVGGGLAREVVVQRGASERVIAFATPGRRAHVVFRPDDRSPAAVPAVVTGPSCSVCGLLGPCAGCVDSGTVSPVNPLLLRVIEMSATIGVLRRSSCACPN